MTKIELIQSLHDQMQAVEFEESDRIEMALPFMTLLRDHCGVVGIEWYIHTPSFNDGDPCEISFYETVKLAFKEDEDQEEEEEDEEDEEVYFHQIPDTFQIPDLDAEIAAQINAVSVKYKDLINLLMNTGNLDTNTRYIYSWDGDVVTEDLEEYYEY